MRAHLSNGPVQLSGALPAVLAALLPAVPTIRPARLQFPLPSC